MYQNIRIYIKNDIILYLINYPVIKLRSSQIMNISSIYPVISNDFIDETLENVFPNISVNVYESSDYILNPAPGLIHHNFKVVVYKSQQYVIEIKEFNGFNNKQVFMCWISNENNEIKLAYGKTESIRLLFEILTS